MNAILRLAAGIPVLIVLGMVLVVLAFPALFGCPFDHAYAATERFAERVGKWAYQ